MYTSVRGRAAFVAVIATALLTVAGCGSSSSSSSPSGSGTPSGDNAALLATAQTNVTKFEQGSPFPELAAAYSPGTGKVAIIACGLAGPDCKNGAEAAKQAAEQMGWTGTIFDAQFSSQKAAAFIDQAVQQGYDGVVSIAQPVEQMKASVDNAIAKGLTVACVACFKAAGMDKVYFAAVDWSEQGRQLAWYVINRSQAQAKVLVYDAPNQAVNARVAGFKEVLEGECSTCSIVATSTVDQSELAKPGPPTFVADMAKYPEGTLTDVADPFDSIGVPMMKTLKASGRTDVTVSGYDSTIEGINAMINNSLPIGGSMALPWSFAAYAGVDAVARAKAGAPAYDATALPTVLITKNNASKFTTSYYQPEGFPADFLKSWGKS